MQSMINSIPAAEGITTIAAGKGAPFDFGDVHFEWKVRTDDSAHHYTMFELTLGPDQGIHLHSHPSPETFYVLEGIVNFFRVENNVLENVKCTVGTTVNIPPNALHALFNQSDQRVRLLDVSTPSHQAFFDAVSKAHAERVFDELDQRAVMEKMTEIGRQHEMHLVPFDVRTGTSMF